jgi:hypothetical protein
MHTFQLHTILRENKDGENNISKTIMSHVLCST